MPIVNNLIGFALQLKRFWNKVTMEEVYISAGGIRRIDRQMMKSVEQYQFM